MATTLQDLKNAALNMANGAPDAVKAVFNEYSNYLNGLPATLPAGERPGTFQEFVARLRTDTRYNTDAGKNLLKAAEDFYNTNGTPVLAMFKQKISDLMGAGGGVAPDGESGGSAVLGGGIGALLGILGGLTIGGGSWVSMLIGALLLGGLGAVGSKYIGQAIDWVGRQISSFAPETGQAISGFGQSLSAGTVGAGTVPTQPVITPTGDKVKVKDGAKIIAGINSFIDAPADPSKASDVAIKLGNEDVFTGHVEGDKFVVTSYARKMSDGRMGSPVALDAAARPKLTITDGAININDPALAPAKNAADAANAEAIKTQNLALQPDGTLGIQKATLREFTGVDGRKYRLTLFGKEDGGKVTFTLATMERTNAAGAWETVKKPDGNPKEFRVSPLELAVNAAGGAKTVTMDNWAMDHRTDAGSKLIIGEERAAVAAIEARRAQARALITKTIAEAPNAAQAIDRLVPLLKTSIDPKNEFGVKSTGASLEVAKWYMKKINREKTVGQAVDEIANMDTVKALPEAARNTLVNDIIKIYHTDIGNALTTKNGAPGDIVASAGGTVPMAPRDLSGTAPSRPA